tara:strand:+ start:168 stop:4115 length:3948 start_codon:yes stop_codon:yes gene_type:complete
MNRFSRIRHHVNMEDVKKKRLYNITVKRRKEEEKREIEEISKKYRSNWKKELFEGMSTGSMYTQDLPSEGNTPIDIRNPVDSASYEGTTGVINPGDNLGANVGTVIRDSGTGSGTDGGFNVEGQYLAFQGAGSGSNNTRFAALSPIDSSQVDTLSITAIVGNDVNGGEDPDLASEGLLVMYKTPAMANAAFLSIKPDNSAGEGDGIIIPSPASHDGGLNNYSIKIPEYARAEGTQFVLVQVANSGSEFDNYGVTNINFQRRAPINVVVSLDDPAAISFISVGTNEGDPKKRKKKINDQLEASDKYTKNVMGSQFPGQGARIEGDDPFRSTTLTSDDDIKASPVGSDEVKKTFNNFSLDAATAAPPAETEAETEPVTPSTQTSMTPTTDDGEEISVKTLGGKNSGIVQGADAATLDAQEPEITEPETTQLEIDEPEEIKPEEIKASEEEKQDKTPEEIKGIEKEKFNAKANESANYIDKLINFRLDQGLDSLNALAQVTGAVVNTGLNITSFALNALGMKEANGFLQMLTKVQNSIDIARSVLSGKITNANVFPQDIKTFADSMKLDEFQAKKIFISDVRHEYADDNIYVKDGKVYQNGDGKNQKGLYATPLANQGFKGMDVHGSGYAQMIIPKDGSEPYLHYYDHNYENLNNASDVNPTGGIVQSIDEIWSSLFGPEDLVLPNGKVYKGLGKANPVDIVAAGFKSMSHVIHQLKSSNTKFLPTRLKDSMLTYFGSFDQVWEGLLNTSIEGFPPGIHGSALTDFKVPLSKLPQETQEMIANHPLSWTPERIANMSSDDFIDQMISRTEDITSPDELTSAILKALEDPDSEVDPEFLRIYKRSTVIQDDYDKAVEELDKVRNTPEYNAASDAALKEYKDINAERKEKVAENDEKFGNKALLNLWEKLVGPYYRAVRNAIKGGGSISKNDPTYQKMINGNKEYEKQVKVLQKKYAQGEKNIVDKYKKLLDEAYAKYNDTITVKKLDDGTFGMVNGGDFTTKDGKVIPGKRTLSAKQQAKFDEVKAEQDEIREYFRTASDEVIEDNMIKPFVLYDVRTKFSEYGISGESWSPEKKGSGLNTPPSSPPNTPPSPSPKPYDPFANEVKPGLGAKPGDELASSLSGGSYGGYYDVGGGDFRGLDQILKMYNDPSKKSKYPGYMLKNIDQLMIDLDLVNKPNDSNLGSIGSYVGGDTTAAATVAAFNKDKRNKNNKKGSGNVTAAMVAHYKPKGTNLFEKLKSKPFFNPKDIKPTFPENDPPQLDPKTGMHPNYGKQAGRYKKLDPISADSMPPTGDSEIDAVVKKQKTKRTFSKIKKFMKDA